MTRIYDFLIMSAGPAGLSVALILSRIHRKSVVFSNSKFRNAGIHAWHSVLSRDYLPSEDIRSIGRQQIERYGNTEFIETTITKVSTTSRQGYNAFTAEGENGKILEGRTIAPAKGSEGVFLNIPGYEENWPLDIYQRLFCDGNERADLTKGVLAYPFSSMYMIMAPLAHYQSLPPGAGHVTVSGEEGRVMILTTGEVWIGWMRGLKKMFETSKALWIINEERKIQKLVMAKAEGLDVVFGDGKSLYIGVLVHKPHTMPKAKELIEQLGVEMTETPLGKDAKRIEPMGMTNVQDMYVRGNLGTVVKQVTAAAFHGVTTAAGISHELTAQDCQIALVWYKDMNVENRGRSCCDGFCRGFGGVGSLIGQSELH